MPALSNSVEKAMQAAIRLEIDGREFFEHAAQITEKEKGKKMFQWLAGEEVKHLQTFGDLFTDIVGDEDWQKYVDQERAARTTAPLITRLEKNMRKPDAKGEVEAIRVGMDLEREAINYFEKAAEETSDPTATEIFNNIAKEEHFHYDLLQAQYDSVTRSGFWLGSAEFQMDGMW